MTKNRTSSITPNIDSLEDLLLRKQQLQEELETSEEHLSNIWNAMFRQPSDEDMKSPTKRIMANIASASALIDGALLGWKLYRRLGGTIKIFSSRKKK